MEDFDGWGPWIFIEMLPVLIALILLGVLIGVGVGAFVW
jgi:hypothetical protein